jgi:chromosome segregation ATPase
MQDKTALEAEISDTKASLTREKIQRKQLLDQIEILNKNNQETQKRESEKSKKLNKEISELRQEIETLKSTFPEKEKLQELYDKYEDLYLEKLEERHRPILEDENNQAPNLLIKSYFELLGIQTQNPNETEINSAYKKFALAHHPDRNPRQKDPAKSIESTALFKNSKPLKRKI